MFKKDAIAIVVVRFHSEIEMALALDILRKNKLEQKLISKIIKVANKNFRLFSPGISLSYEQFSKHWKRIKKVNDYFKRGNYSIEVILGYVDAYHVVFFQAQPNFTNLYFKKNIYQSMELLRKPLEWEKTQYCHELFFDHRAITFCDDLYRLLKKEEL